MSDFSINKAELDALCGLPHQQQIVYFRGIRPFMDRKNGVAGVMRRISYQSIAEQLYVEPHQGIKSTTYSRAQIRRAISSLERVGLVDIQSDDQRLIVKCKLATLGYFVQNKAVTNPSQKADIPTYQQHTEYNPIFDDSPQNADTPIPPKAAIPLYKEDNYVCLLSRFDQFWQLYPEKKSHGAAKDAFMRLQPDASLFTRIMQALDNQIHHRNALIAAGQWQPKWKYAANWLAQRCWEDELSQAVTQEKQHAARRTVTQSHDHQSWYDLSDDSEPEAPKGNVYDFRQRKAGQ
ncbi:vir region protein [Legionella geestiana]|uniref:Vir region protein n=1 Tax=Legionella geestiana TaxID=45065 RepID=A0A0W0U1U9_9GAMM|nr:hypothetical protein [Legionella geestiana]KTD02115.1 vir region protein [Legionella geestiana]QBS11550.1 hypothetical protein E4T54_01680 [Legionella geestiana]STX53777.1 Legionella vir region protein [Legionella geestiana]